MKASAIALTSGHYDTVFAKTTHGLVRGPSRYPLFGVIDARFAGCDAGMMLDGRTRNIPIFTSVTAAIDGLATPPTHCIVGVATVGGLLPEDLYADLEAAARAGLTLVNGLHQLLADDTGLAALAHEHGGGILDIRRPRPASELRFWSGEVLALPTPRVAVMGMDCAIGKRTTCMLVRDACRQRGIRAEMIYTGQTGWLQGLQHGFIFDATLNDFVSGELEGAILTCQRDTDAKLILMEGQSALRNPSGPAGSEFLLSGAAHGVILQHAPQRRFYEDFEDIACRIPPVSEEIELIRLYGSEVWAVTLFTRGLSQEEARREQRALAERLGIPVCLPVDDGVGPVVDVIQRNIGHCAPHADH